MEFNGQLTLLHGNCIQLLDTIPMESVDAIICNPPYGTTQCKWDSVINLDTLWPKLWRVCKPNANVILTASQPFTANLIMSQIAHFKYCWVYQKTKATNFFNARKGPLKYHEDICVFNRGVGLYQPQMEIGEPYTRTHINDNKSDCAYGQSTSECGSVTVNKGTRFPSSIIKPISNPSGRGQLHPTQKPVELMEYLVKTYTREGDTVLDFTMGSGTTGVACLNLNRTFIGIELNKTYFQIATKRLQETYNGV